MDIESKEKLRELYGFPKGRAKNKLLPKLEKHSRKYISLSPFVLISTCGQDGNVDCSPRGGQAGFVEVLSDDYLLVPDSKGNNRLDSFVNIVDTGKIGCLFVIPGVDETLRINGEAKISILPDHLNRFESWSNPPRSCIEIKIKEVFLHCAKAFMRAKLWDSDSRIDRSVLPTMGRMINDQLLIDDEPESQEQMIKRYNKDL